MTASISGAFTALSDMLTLRAATAKEKPIYAVKGQLFEVELTALPSGFWLEAVIGLQVSALDGKRYIVVVAN